MKLYQMIPFLKGWTATAVNKQITVRKGVYQTIFSREFQGWLFGFDMISDDAYAKLRVTYLGQAASYKLHDFFTLGAVIPPPAGLYLNVYIRPSILSTAGIFVGSPFTLAESIPLKGLVRIELILDNDSTQATANIMASVMLYEVTDEKLFIKSVRKFLFGWLGWFFGAISNFPGLKYVGIPNEVKEVLDITKEEK
jgi:hypothetical protein